VLYIFLHSAGASSSVSVLTCFVLFIIWLLVDALSVFLGSWLGYRSEKIEVPAETNEVAKSIPSSPGYLKPPILFLLGGVLVSYDGSISTEMQFFVLFVIIYRKIYCNVTFLFTTLLYLTICCGGISNVVCYCLFKAYYHQWWWESFFCCARAGLYLLMNGLLTMTNSIGLEDTLPNMVALTFLGLAAICYSLFCGPVGFLSAFLFTETIYRALKVSV
jgi:transmembrane 9 superfamily protein 2/4